MTEDRQTGQVLDISAAPAGLGVGRMTIENYVRTPMGRDRSEPRGATPRCLARTWAPVYVITP